MVETNHPSTHARSSGILLNSTLVVAFGIYSYISISSILQGFRIVISTAMPPCSPTSMPPTAMPAPAMLHYGITLEDLSCLLDNRIAVQLAASAFFSAVNIALAMYAFQFGMRARNWSARALGFGLVGTAAAYSFPAHIYFHGLALRSHQSFLDPLHITFHLIAGSTLIYALITFPDGRLSPYWTKRFWSTLSILLAIFLIFVLELFDKQQQPIAFNLYFGIVILGCGLFPQIGSYISPASDQEREDAKLLLRPVLVILGAGAILAAFVLSAFWGKLSKIEDPQAKLDWIVLLVFPPLLIPIPVVLFMGIVGRRLWNVNRIINRTLFYILLSGFSTAIYLLIVQGFEGRTSSEELDQFTKSLAASLLIVLVVDRVKSRFDESTRALVYGDRRSPYDVLRDLSNRLAESRSMDDTLSGIAEVVGRGVGAAKSRITLFPRDAPHHSVSWPESFAIDDTEQTVPVVHRGQRVGEISIALSNGMALSSHEQQLLRDLAREASFPLGNLLLTDELQKYQEQVGKLRAKPQIRRRIFGRT
jgi:hypothetical protein